MSENETVYSTTSYTSIGNDMMMIISTNTSSLALVDSGCPVGAPDVGDLQIDVSFYGQTLKKNEILDRFGSKHSTTNNQEGKINVNIQDVFIFNFFPSAIADSSGNMRTSDPFSDDITQPKMLCHSCFHSNKGYVLERSTDSHLE
eukprot:g57510.t1